MLHQTTVADSHLKNVSMNPTISKAISLLRFPLMIGVLFIHNQSTIITNLDTHEAGNVFYELVCLYGSHIFSFICVPAFFFISGYLFFSHIDTFDQSSYSGKIAKRIKTLLIPYLLWNLIPISILLIKNVSSGSLGEISLRDFLVFFWDYKQQPGACSVFGYPVPCAFPIDGPLWYVRDLMLICLLSPLVYYFIKYTRKIGLFALILVYVLQVWPFMVFMQGISLCFFSMGAYSALNHVSFTNKNSCYLSACLFLVFSVASYFVRDNLYLFLLIRCINSVFGVLTLMYLSVLFVSRYSFSWPKLFIDSIFFVYAMHSIYINSSVGAYLLPSVLPGHHYLLLTVKYLLAPCITWMICVCVLVIMRKCAPMCLRVLNGGRC